MSTKIFQLLLSSSRYYSVNKIIIKRLIRSNQIVSNESHRQHQDLISTASASSIIETNSNTHNQNELNALSEVEKDSFALDFLNSIAPPLKKSFNLAAYINRSITLQKLLQLDVNLSKIDKDVNLASFIVRCDFENDIQPLLILLLDYGINGYEAGDVLNKNPYLLTINPDDLKTKINYFLFHKFTKENIGSILRKFPQLFSLKLPTIDENIAALGEEYALNPKEIRHVIQQYPKIVTLNQVRLKRCTFTFHEEMGFTETEIKSILLRYPILWLRIPTTRYTKTAEMQTFNYVHNEMKIPLDLIVKFPMILIRRQALVRERHLYLKALKRDQFDPKKPLYVPLKAFYQVDDAEFCLKYCKTSVNDFNEFLKTL
ncbi:Down syndrome cell adhesion molecule-like protein 1 [Sarcoptes scabiei]|nr:Down syndrome cell adhesion molecule-like protein 1 [Sarcoptes scabiei]